MSRITRSVLAAALTVTALPLLTTTSTVNAQAETRQDFHRLATYPVYRNLPSGVPASSETVAEISSVTPDGDTLIYTDALGKRIGFLDISDPAHPEGAGSYDLTAAGDPEDEPTSVAVAGKYVLVVVNTSESYARPSGRLDVVRISDAKRVRSIDLGGQPDSIALSKDGRLGIIAIENERDEEFAPEGLKKGDLPQLPAGFVQTLDLTGAVADWTATKVAFTNADVLALPAFTAAGVVEPTDPEPEYVAINAAGKAAVTLQENNAIVVLDVASGAIENVFSAGTVSVTGIDTAKDGVIDLSGSITDVPREPDAVAWIGDDRLATANEGDWHGGSRGWTVFDTTGSVVWDAGNTFERLAVTYGLESEDRAAKKGTEPEGIAIAEFNGTPLALVGSERSNFVAVYDVNDPSTPRFRQVLPTSNGPEGILPIPGRDLLAVSSEVDDADAGVRSTVGLYQLAKGVADFPSIVSADRDGAPIGWSALGALSGKPGDANTIYTASDTVLTNGAIYTVDVARTPAVITDRLPVTEDGSPVPLDVEGLFARPQGGFWLASEGTTGAKNQLVRTDAAGVVQQRVALPSDIAAKVGKWGLEGVTATTDAGGEHVWFVLQRPLWSNLSTLDDFEGDDVTRIGRYDVTDGSFHWYGYRLNAPQRGSGDWVGLSEITAINDHTFAVIERDKLNGPAARNKRIYTVTVPTAKGPVTDPSTSELPILDKRLAIDVLPALRATNGWTQEKLEGFTIAADGSLYAVTDNDGLKDATGETVFLRLGRATDAFATELASSTKLSLSASTARYSKKVTARVTLGGAATGGVVELREGTTVLGRVRVTKSTATIAVPRLKPGRHRLTAVFIGSALAAPSRSAAVTLTITKASSTTTLTAPASARKGKPVRVSVKVVSDGHTPTGRVRIVRGSTVLSTQQLTKGKATVTVRLSTGRTQLQAVYLGSATTNGSVSTKRSIVVR